MIEEFLQALAKAEPWRKKAACRGMDIKDFFPERGYPTKVARAACAKCPVRKQCEGYADRSDSNYGIWGGEMRSRAPGAHT